MLSQLALAAGAIGGASSLGHPPLTALSRTPLVAVFGNDDLRPSAAWPLADGGFAIFSRRSGHLDLIQLGCGENYLASERILAGGHAFLGAQMSRMAIRRNVARFGFRAVPAPPAGARQDR
jgi:hypothetical protein